MPEPLVRLRWPDEAPAKDALDTARATLVSERCLALPTEAGYVIAALADARDALERLPAGRRVRAVQAEALAARPFGHLLRRLAERYWPGPLVLESGDHAAPALQATSHTGTAALAAALATEGRTLLWTLARDAGGRVLTDPDAVERALGAGLGAIADGGPTRLDEGPAVLEVAEGRFELLEPGLLPIGDLRRVAGLRVLFVCTGNTCRSPMAAALSRALLAERLGTDDLALFGFDVASAGVFANHGSPASEHAVTAVRELGADLANHRSQPARAELVAAADRVYCLTRSHLEALRLALPPGRAGHVALLDPDGRDVADPVGGSLDDYRLCARQIAAALRGRAIDWV